MKSYMMYTDMKVYYTDSLILFHCSYDVVYSLLAIFIQDEISLIKFFLVSIRKFIKKSGKLGRASEKSNTYELDDAILSL